VQGTFYEWQYLLQTAFVDAKLKAAVNAACDWAAAATNQAQALSSQCVKLLNQASAEIAHVNLYNIYGDWCGPQCILLLSLPYIHTYIHTYIHMP
jgi:hypothetical protein